MRLEISEDASPDKAAARGPPTLSRASAAGRRRFRSEAAQARARTHARARARTRARTLVRTFTYVRVRQARCATQMNAACNGRRAARNGHMPCPARVNAAASINPTHEWPRVREYP
jgi:hypothetical protein